MLRITNPVFTEIEKLYLDFILQADFPKKSDIITQLSNVTAAEILRDITPYHWIIEFCAKSTQTETIHPCVKICASDSPTQFTLYELNGHICKLEICNSDHTPMNLDTIMGGEPLLCR